MAKLTLIGSNPHEHIWLHDLREHPRGEVRLYVDGQQVSGTKASQVTASIDAMLRASREGGSQTAGATLGGQTEPEKSAVAPLPEGPRPGYTDRDPLVFDPPEFDYLQDTKRGLEDVLKNVKRDTARSKLLFQYAVALLVLTVVNLILAVVNLSRVFG